MIDTPRRRNYRKNFVPWETHYRLKFIWVRGGWVGQVSNRPLPASLDW